MPVYYRIITRLFTILSLLNNFFSSAMNVTIILTLYRRCCCCFSLFLTHQPLKVFFTLSQRTNLRVLKRMTLFVPFAGQVQHLLISLSLVSIGKLTEFFPIPVYTSSSFVVISGWCCEQHLTLFRFFISSLFMGPNFWKKWSSILP